MKTKLIALIFLVFILQACLRNSEIISETNTSASLNGSVNNSFNERIHIIMNLSRQVNMEEFDVKFRTLGVNVIIPFENSNNLWISVPKNSLEELSKIDLVKSIQEANPSEKIEIHYPIPKSAVNEDGTLTLIVLCHKDVDSKTCEDFLREFGNVSVYAAPNYFVIRGAKNTTIEKISHGDVIRRITLSYNFPVQPTNSENTVKGVGE